MNQNEDMERNKRIVNITCGLVLLNRIGSQKELAIRVIDFF